MPSALAVLRFTIISNCVRLLHRQIGWISSLQDLVDDQGGAAVKVWVTGPKRHEAADIHELS